MDFRAGFKFTVSPTVLLIVEHEDRRLEHIAHKLVALSLREHGGNVHGAELVQPFELAVVKFVVVESLELLRHV